MAWFYKFWSDQGPDTGWSWLVCCMCFLITFGTFGTYRSSSVLYVEVLKVYQLTREAASYPFSVCGVTNSLAGIPAGFLGHYLSNRQVTMSGSIFSAIGLILCYFSHSIIWITVCYGVIFGIGVGMVMTSLPVVIGQYFSKNKTTANGIFLAGSSLSTFIFPIVQDYFIGKFSLSGTFLLLAAIAIQTILFGSLIRPIKHDWTQTYPLRKLYDKGNDKHDFGSAVTIPLTSKHNSAVFRTDEEKCSQTITNSYMELQKEIEEEGASSVYRATTEVIEPKVGALTIFKRIILNPMFAVVTFSSVSMSLMVLTVTTVIVDYGMDKNLTRNESIYLVSVIGIAELVGRTCFGWVTDRGFFSRKVFMIFAQIVSGVLLIIISIVYTPILLFILNALFGLVTGTSYALINVLLMEYTRPEETKIAFGLMRPWTALAFMIRPNIIGLFRDKIGSYDFMMCFLGGLSLISGLFWNVEKCFTKKTIPVLTVTESFT